MHRHRTPRHWLAAVLTLFALTLGGCVCGDERTMRTADGRDRSYLVYAPPTLTGPAPIVLVLHGGGGNAAGTRESLGFDALADQHGFVAVYPNGIGKRFLGKLFGTWNSDHVCCGQAHEEGVDDVAFLSQLIDVVAAEHGGDAEHVFATGISNGGDMSHRLACELSERIDAVVPVGAPVVIEGCAPTRPVPVKIIHGSADPCALYEGGEVCGGCWTQAIEELTGSEAAEDADTFPCQAVPEQAAGWRARNGCGEVATSSDTAGAATCQVFADGCAGAEVELCTIEGGGHTWPGTEYGCKEGTSFCDAYVDAVGPISADLDGPAAAWAFFAAHLDR